MFAVDTSNVAMHIDECEIRLDTTNRFVSGGQEIVSARFTLARSGHANELSLYAHTPEEMAALGWAILGAAAQMRPVAPPQTEAHAAIEAYADAESGVVGVAGR